MKRKHWKLVYLLRNPEWTGKAVCVDKKDKQIQLYIPSLDMQTFIVPQKKYELNDTLSVKASNIDIPQQTVAFVPL